MIRVDDLSKDYGSVRAVDHITFEVRSGEVLGFLGPNGAGKTTTMKILTCFQAPTSGSVKVAGFDVTDQSLEVRRRIGYLPEDTPLYRDMLVYDYLEFIAEVRGVDREHRKDKIREITKLCGIAQHLGRPIGELSKGYRQRVGLAQAMVHDPEILILDEPTSGLDPNQIVEIRSLIKEIGKQKTVILSTHILPEVQATCSRVVIIAGGKLVADGTPEELSSREKGDRYFVTIEGAPSPEVVRAKLMAIEGVTRCEAGKHLRAVDEKAAPGTHSPSFDFTLDAGQTGTDLRREIFRAVVASNWTLLELTRKAASLEDIFRKLTHVDVDAAANLPAEPAPAKTAERI
jgi:ABC-2 type transport system ATP-binding protein